MYSATWFAARQGGICPHLAAGREGGRTGKVGGGGGCLHRRGGGRRWGRRREGAAPWAHSLTVPRVRTPLSRARGEPIPVFALPSYRGWRPPLSRGVAVAIPPSPPPPSLPVRGTDFSRAPNSAPSINGPDPLHRIIDIEGGRFVQLPRIRFRGWIFVAPFTRLPSIDEIFFSLSYISWKESKKFNFYEEYIKSRARVTSPSTELLKSTFVYKTPTCKSIHDTNLEHVLDDPWHSASSMPFCNFPKTEPVPVIGRLKRIGRTTESTESERERVDASQGERGRAEIDGWTKLWRRGPPRVFRPCDGGQIYGRLATQTSVSLRILGLPPILLAIASSF